MIGCGQVKIAWRRGLTCAAVFLAFLVGLYETKYIK